MIECSDLCLTITFLAELNPTFVCSGYESDILQKSSRMVPFKAHGTHLLICHDAEPQEVERFWGSCSNDSIPKVHI